MPNKLHGVLSSNTCTCCFIFTRMVNHLVKMVFINLMGIQNFRRKYSVGTFSKECKEQHKIKFRTSASGWLHIISRKSFEANEVSRPWFLWGEDWESGWCTLVNYTVFTCMHKPPSQVNGNTHNWHSGTMDTADNTILIPFEVANRQRFEFTVYSYMKCFVPLSK